MKAILLLSLSISSTLAMANSSTLIDKYEGLYEQTSCRDLSTGEAFAPYSRTTILVNINSNKKTHTTLETLSTFHEILNIVPNSSAKIDNHAERSGNAYKSDFLSKNVTTHTTTMDTKKLTYKRVDIEKDPGFSLIGPNDPSTNSKNTIVISTDGKKLTTHSKFQSKGEKTQEYLCIYKKI